MRPGAAPSQGLSYGRQAGADEAQHRAALGRLTALGARTASVADLLAARTAGS
ncbi:hypothetical protein [Streptomyces gibsoniae]|uniref:Uncharacterized protein n=1 Tax=Streptomyces gibsoniae TaxID=3075529 RepID=A0ABU2TTS1_9ACTN|nr:hypothetical protein [Streptomyces sp. DSM 41699]MDT0464334.1 hypothetical protein [Streptomyces sp. DSM 41699]